MVRSIAIKDNPSYEEIEAIKLAHIEEFQDVFMADEESLPPMEGKEMKINLIENYTPFAVKGVQPVPYAHRDTLKEYFENMVKKQIFKHADNEPTEWVSPMLVITKKNGKPRVCIDYTKLNKFVKRSVYPFQSPRDAVADIPTYAR